MSAVAQEPTQPLETPIAVPFGSVDAEHEGRELRTADANRLFYADHAAAYDGSEHCIAHASLRELLAGVLDRAIAVGPSSAPRTLDACGGTGNVSELLARRGIETTLADVSPEMLARWREKAAWLGVTADTVEGEIDSFLTSDGREWDLIVFSSALHHVDDPVGVAALAAGRLAPGGVLVTAFDPIRSDDATTQRLRRFDYLLSLAADPQALRAALGRRIKRREAGGVNVGELAEKHALEGVDDAAIVARLEAGGAEIVEHRRYACQRYRLTERIIRALRRSTTFHLIARRPPGPSTHPTVSE